jgi:Fic family protein
MQLLTRITLAYYQFEALHPFTDDNGRIGRLVCILQMMSEEALRSPVLSVSVCLKDNAEAYRDHLVTVSQTGAWTPWVEFFTTAVREEAKTDTIGSCDYQPSDRSWDASCARLYRRLRSP